MYPSLPPTAFFFVLIYSKCFLANAGNGISEILNLKTFWETCAQTPYFGVRFGALTFLPVRTASMPLHAPKPIFGR